MAQFRLIFIALAALLFAGIGAGVYLSQPAAATNLTPADPTMIERAKNGEIILLDVRSPEEFAEGHIPGAINVPHDHIDEYLATLSDHKDKPVVVYCRSGRRADLVIDVLKQHEFNDLRHLEGDMMGWGEAGYPIDQM